MRTAPLVSGLASAIVVSAFLVACDRGPTTPGIPAPAANNAIGVALEIVGPRSVAPGETVQLSMILRLSNGSTQDVTNETTWQTPRAAGPGGRNDRRRHRSASPRFLTWTCWSAGPVDRHHADGSQHGLPAQQTDGVSLVDLMSGRRRHLGLDGNFESMYPQRFGWSPLRALSDGRFKVIDAPRPELYDLDRDPFEEHNLYDERRDLASALHSRLRAVRSERSSPAPAPDDLRERLASLGYVGAHQLVSSVFERKALPDPKDCIKVRDLSTANPIPSAAPPAHIEIPSKRHASLRTASTVPA